jgi:hypothetical protein
MALCLGIVNPGNHPEAQGKPCALPSEGRGREFESRRVRQQKSEKGRGFPSCRGYTVAFPRRPERDRKSPNYLENPPRSPWECGNPVGKCSRPVRPDRRLMPPLSIVLRAAPDRQSRRRATRALAAKVRCELLLVCFGATLKLLAPGSRRQSVLAAARLVARWPADRIFDQDQRSHAGRGDRLRGCGGHPRRRCAAW